MTRVIKRATSPIARLRRGDRRRQPRRLRDGDPARARGRCASPWSRSSPIPAAFKRVCSHFIQASAVPTLERLDLLEPIVAAGGRALADPRLDAVGLDRTAARAGRATPSTCAASCSTRWCARRRRRPPGVEPDPRTRCTQPARATAGSSAASPSAIREGAGDGAAGQLVVGADGRDSRIAELAGGRGEDLAPRALRLRRLLRGPGCPTAPRTARSGCWTRTGRRPSRPTATSSSTRRCRPRTVCPSSRRDPEEALVSFVGRRAGRAADPT